MGEAKRRKRLDSNYGKVKQEKVKSLHDLYKDNLPKGYAQTENLAKKDSRIKARIVYEENKKEEFLKSSAK